jgi:hypothetical protein
MKRLATLATLLLVTNSFADEPSAAILKDLTAAAKQGTASAPAARAAWDKLVARGPAALPHILVAMDTSDTVVANWLRTAFERIVDDDYKAGGKGIDPDPLLAFAKDPKRQGRARRFALELVERIRPGSSDKLIPGWLGDPEFGHDAVTVLLKESAALAKNGDKEKAIAGYRQAFAASRDVPQVQVLASRLKENGIAVSVAEHLGFLTDWYVIGPFDARDMKGFKAIYPPEEKIDLAAELDGRDGKLKWKRYRVKEALSGLPARVALVNLLEPLGEHHDCVAYAYTAFSVPAAEEVEFRGSADDNFQVWVNGKREFGFEEYRNGVRLDRHRFKVKLHAGENKVLVKICQAPLDTTNPEPNWEFLLRMVNGAGEGVKFKNTLPLDK